MLSKNFVAKIFQQLSLFATLFCDKSDRNLEHYFSQGNTECQNIILTLIIQVHCKKLQPISTFNTGINSY